MSSQQQPLFDAALLLPEFERGELAARLMDTLQAIPEFHEEWDDEIRLRLDDMQSGRDQGIPWEQVRKELMDIRDAAAG